MLRTRHIKPSITSNPDLGRMGPIAEVIFTRLWMLADREGRLEYDPARIKYEALANYPEITAETVAEVVENLSKSDMVVLYQGPSNGIRQKQYLAVTNFHKHQWVHKNEKPSEIPEPQPVKTKRISRSKTHGKLPGATSNGALVTSNKSGTTSSSKLLSSVPLTPPPFNGSDEPSNGGGVRVREESSPQPEADPPPPLPPGRPERKPPTSSNGNPETAEVVRNALGHLAAALHMPEPDEGIVQQVVDIAGLSPPAYIAEVLRGLYLQRRFSTMRSWGLVPVVIRPWFAGRRGTA